MAGRYLGLLVVVGAAVALSTDASSISVSSFAELAEAVDARVSSLILVSREYVFPHQLEICGKTLMSIESTVGSRLDGNSSVRLFFLDGESQLSLRGVNLVRGSCKDCFGGAIFASNRSKLTLNSVQICNSHAHLGGAIFTFLSNVTANNSTFIANSADSRGGAVCGDVSVIKFTSSTMSHNRAGKDNSHGGAVSVEDAALTFTSGTFSHNWAVRGGAVHATGASSVAILNCTMHHNFAHEKGGVVIANGRTALNVIDSFIAFNGMSENIMVSQGGALAMEEDTVATLSNSTLLSNTANLGGAICAGHVASVTVIESTISSNLAAKLGVGGGVLAYDKSNIVAHNSTMSWNKAFRGGALYVMDSAAITTNGCTLDSNSAARYGGVIFTEYSGSFAATGCQFKQNSASSGGTIYALGASAITIQSCAMSLNVASAMGGVACADDESVVTFTQCTLHSNSAMQGGAVVTFDSSAVALSDCDISLNIANQEGGAMLHESTLPIELTDCSVVSNNAQIGGALVVATGSDASLRATLFQSNVGLVRNSLHPLCGRAPCISRMCFPLCSPRVALFCRWPVRCS